MTTWTPSMLERAETMWGEGRSAKEIATAIGGLSRNAVCGMVGRRGWRREGEVRMSKPRTAPKPRAALKPRSARTRRATAAQRESLRNLMGRPAHKGPYVPPAVLVEPPASAAVTLMQRKARQCCWPVGEATGVAQLFCGAAKEFEQSYCPFHRGKAWRRAA